MTFSCNNLDVSLVAGRLISVHAEYVMWVTIGFDASMRCREPESQNQRICCRFRNWVTAWR